MSTDNKDAVRDAFDAWFNDPTRKTYAHNECSAYNGYRAAHAAQAERIAELEKGLQFYASGDHFTMHEPSAWDTVSGEPANFYEDESNTATVEDGSIATMALSGALIPDDDEVAHPVQQPGDAAADDDCFDGGKCGVVGYCAHCYHPTAQPSAALAATAAIEAPTSEPVRGDSIVPEDFGIPAEFSVAAKSYAEWVAASQSASVEDAQDAAMCRWLRDSKFNALYLTRNEDHSTNYVTAKEWIEEYSPEAFAHDDPDEVQAMKDTDTIWHVQIYPDTPIGSYSWHGATLDSALGAAIAAMTKDSGAGTGKHGGESAS